MIQFLLLLALILGSIGAVRWYLSNAPAASAKKIRRGLIWAAIIAAVVMAATGRLAWLLPLIGALFAMVLRMLPLLLQIAAQSFPQWQRQARARRQTASSPNGSAVQSRFLRMELDHASGTIQGEILEGPHRGRRLSELDVGQLAGLYQTYLRDDRESAALLRAYLERVHGDAWETPTPGHEERSEPRSTGSGRMTAGEAYEVLGLAVGATRDEIVSAHRRLMQKLHPDRGGSDYLASKINQAKDVLLGY